MSLKIGVQVYSVRENAAADLRSTFKAIKEMGYDGVELAGRYTYSVEEIRSFAEEAGLEIISAHVGFSELLPDIEGTLKAYKAIGVSYVAIPHVSAEYRPDGEKFLELIELEKKIGKIAKDLGIQLLYHNHDFEFTKYEGVYGLDYMYDHVDADLLKTELDMCWVNVAGADPVPFLKKYAGRAPIVHMKDFWGDKSEQMYELIGVDSGKPNPRPSNFEFRPVGFGKQDVPAIVNAAIEGGAEWVVVEQDKPSMGLTPMESIRLSRLFLQAKGF